MEKNKQAQVSIIVPVYNTEKYLRQCLNSLLAQTCPDFEVICIDDGSSDNSVKILQEYTAKDSRFSYYIQDHKNCGAARNNGMSHAVGKYYLFIDSDDMLTPDALEAMLSRAEKTGADICAFQFQTMDNQTGKRITCSEPAKPDIYLTETFSMKDNPRDIYRFTTPTASKLFRKEFVQKSQLYFQETGYAEDIAFSFTALALAERISVVAKPLYIYRVNNSSSIIGSKDRNPLGFHGALLETRKRLIERGLYAQIEPAFINYVAYNFFFHLNACKSPLAFEIVFQFIKNTALAEYHLDDKPDGYFYAYAEEEPACRLNMIKNGSMFEYVGKYGPDFGIVQQRMSVSTFKRTILFQLQRGINKIRRMLKA